MLTSAGVAAPDGNELAAWHTGLWGAYLKELQQRQQCLDNGWVSLFTYDPHYGAAIFADWVAQIPNLTWIKNFYPLSVTKHSNKITGVRFNNLFCRSKNYNRRYRIRRSTCFSRRSLSLGLGILGRVSRTFFKGSQSRF